MGGPNNESEASNTPRYTHPSIAAEFHAVRGPVFHVLGSAPNALVGRHVIQIAANHNGHALHIGSRFWVFVPSFRDYDAGEGWPFLVYDRS